MHIMNTSSARAAKFAAEVDQIFYGSGLTNAEMLEALGISVARIVYGIEALSGIPPATAAMGHLESVIMRRIDRLRGPAGGVTLR